MKFLYQNALQLDYLEHMMDKFGSRPEFYNDCGMIHSSLKLHTTLLLDSKSLLQELKSNSHRRNNYDEIIKKCKHVSSNACQLVKNACQKNFDNLNWPTNVVIHVPRNDAALCQHFYDLVLNKIDYNDTIIGCDKLIQNLIIQFPIQIARGFNNQFICMYNGENNPIVYNNCNTVYQLQKTIRFGGYDAVISNWKGEIKVVSSMGKQSTGKSYLLNHLFGSKFDISGMRCTDGAWMTVRIVDDILYVILDFEGLGTFERSPQEDTFLSVFNGAMSNCSIFKCENRFDTDVAAMFELGYIYFLIWDIVVA